MDAYRQPGKRNIGAEQLLPGSESYESVLGALEDYHRKESLLNFVDSKEKSHFVRNQKITPSTFTELFLENFSQHSQHQTSQ